MKDTGFANWDLKPLFPEFRGSDYKDSFLILEDRCNALLTMARSIDQALSSAVAQGEDTSVVLPSLVPFIDSVQDASQLLGHLVAYMECVRAEDITNEAAAEDNSRVDVLAAKFRQVEIYVLAFLKDMPDAQFEQLLAHDHIAPVAYYVKRWREEARHTMSTELESLAVDVEVTGFRAWENLYENVIGKISFDIEDENGARKRVPMAQRVSLLEDASRAVRHSTFVASGVELEKRSDVLAACLNNIAGHRLTVQKRRGITHFLDAAVFDSGMSRATLSAMMESVQASWGLMRRYLALKAKMLGRGKLSFWDLSSPLGGKYALSDAQGVYTWNEACRLVEKAFRSFSPDFGDFANMALDKHWVESEPRAGKSPGGFCTSSSLKGESRIFMTYRGNYGDMSTLAHELGHAYHEWLVRDLPHFCHAYPMTLAETASTFAEQLLGDSMLADPNMDRIQRINMLHRRLDDAATYLLNISMRFYFEEEFYKERASGELSVSRLKSLMAATQERVYGKEIWEEGGLDPWFWAWKGHFYITDVAFYNFPYIFGYLFSLGVYTMARERGTEFLPVFRDLLRETGRGTCEEVASRVLGVDLTTPAFWSSSIALVEADLDALERLVDSMA